MLHPGETPRVPYVTQCLANAPGVSVAASDYVKAMPDSIDRWLPRPLRRRSAPTASAAARAAPALRDFFEVDYRYVIVATLAALARDGKIDANGGRSRRSRRTTSIPRRRTRRFVAINRTRTPSLVSETFESSVPPRARREKALRDRLHAARTGREHRGRRRAARPGQARRHAREGSAGPRARNRQGDDRSALVGRRAGRRRSRSRRATRSRSAR